MEIPYSALPESPQIPNVNSEFQNEEHDEPHSATAVLAVAAHIRSFYRLLVIILTLLMISGVGTAAIVMGYLKNNSCPSSRIMSRWLKLFGIVDLIMCGFIATIVILSFTCCYRRKDCLCSLIFMLVFFSTAILAMLPLFMTISDESKNFSTEYQTTVQSVTKNCEKIVQYTVFVIQISLYSIMSVLSIYSTINKCKQRCQRNVNSTGNSTTAV